MRRPRILTTAEKRRAALNATISSAEHDVLVERRKHVTREGWTTSHDDEHREGEMAFAGACYALAGAVEQPTDHFLNTIFTRYWVWAREWWKPKDRRRNLVRAASLLIAEIERLDRAEANRQ